MELLSVRQEGMASTWSCILMSYRIVQEANVIVLSVSHVESLTVG
jgi:hypothetical protein